MDTLSYRYDRSVFSNFNHYQHWLDPRISWKNKWKNGDPAQGEAVAARWIERVSWDDSKVFINLSRAAIKQAPEYTEESLLTREYETRLHGHYNRQGYWVDEPVSKECST